MNSRELIRQILDLPDDIEEAHDDPTRTIKVIAKVGNEEFPVTGVTYRSDDKIVILCKEK